MPKGQYERRPESERAPTSIPSIIDICQQIPDEKAAIAFLTSRGILTLPKETACCVCGYKGCRVKSKSTPKSLKCNKHVCGKGQSLLRGTIFAGSRMPLHKLLYLSVFWLFQSPAKVVNAQLHCSGKTVADFYKIFRQMIVRIVSSDNGSFGGTNTNTGGGTLDEDLAIITWREQNMNSLWDAFLNDMKRLNEVKEITHWFNSRVDIPLDFPNYGVSSRQVNVAAAAVAGFGAEIGVETQLQPQKLPEAGQLYNADEADTQELEEEKEQTKPSSLSFFQHFVTNQDAAVTAGVTEVRPQRIRPKALQPKKTKQQKALPLKKKRQHATSSLSFEDICTQPEEPDGDSPNPSTSRKRPKKLLSIPSFMDICCLIPTEEKAIEFLTTNGIFTDPKDIICSHCGYQGFRVKEKKSPKALKCNRCSKGMGLMRGTFFEGSSFPLQQALYMAVFWLSLTPASTVVTQLRCSSGTVTTFSNKFRQLIKRYVEGQEGVNVITALQADRNDATQRLKPHIPKFARKGQSNDHIYAATWRERNVDNLWQAFLLVLQTVKNDACVSGSKLGNEPWVKEEMGKAKACCKYHLREHLRKKKLLNPPQEIREEPPQQQVVLYQKRGDVMQANVPH